MEIRKETKTAIVEVEVYVAEDGTEFPTAPMCRAYETRLKRDKLLKNIKALEYREDGKRPCDGEENLENWIYKWYKVNSVEDMEKLRSVYGYICNAFTFPEYINIQQREEDDFDICSTTLTNCKEYVKEFFADFGIEVEFKEV